jgi:hypothetical protein
MLAGVYHKSKKHLVGAKETYWQHFFFASGVGFRLFKTSLAILVHSIVPAFFEHSGSDTVCGLHDVLAKKRDQVKNCKES